MKWLFLLSIRCFNVLCSAQNRQFGDEFSEEQLGDDFVDPDSVDYETYTKKTSSFKALFNGKPGKAIMYGMLIPSGGQFYNRRYWKVPIALALDGAGVATFIVVRGRYNIVDQIYTDVINEVPGVNFRGSTDPTQIFNYRKQWRKWSEQAGVAMIVVHIVIAVESYIDRHLIDFDIDEDLSFEYKTYNINKYSSSSGIALTYNIGGRSYKASKLDKSKLLF